MAIPGSDGSIILTTKIDQSGLNKGMTSIQKGVKSLSSSFNALGSTIAAVFGVTAIIRFSKQSGEFATQTEASVQRLVDIYDEAAQSVGDFIDTNARAMGMSKASAASFASVYGNLFSVWADQNTNAELTNRYLNATAVVASKTGRTIQDVQERIRSGLLGNTEAIEDLGIFVNVKTIEMTDAFQRMASGKSWEQLDTYTQQQVRTMAILEQATAKYGNTVANTTAITRARYQAAYEDFKNTWGQVVNKVLIPVLKVLTQVFTVATKGLQIIAGLTGKTIDNSKLFSSQEKAIGGAVDNQEALTDAVKGTNKELKKSLAGFDEINILSQDTAEGSGASATVVGASIVGGEIGDLGGALDGSSYIEEVDSTLMAIMGIVAEAMVAVGLILLFTGHIGWGIGFIIAGAATLAVTMASASSFEYDGIINMLTTIMGIAGGALLALGIILLWIGGVVGTPVAIGMIIAGGALIVSAVAAKAAFSPDDVGGWLSLIMGIAGGALLALGIILVMVGSVPLGVGMIIAGAIGLVSAVALNFDSVKNSITGWVAVIMAIAGAALLVLGIVLCCTGAGIALGIALIVAGAVSLVTPVALNWNYISEQVTKFFQDNAGLIVGVSLALLVLGVILLFTGVGIPLAIGLIVAGATGLTATVALNWNYIKEKTVKIFNDITDWVKTWGLLILGIILVVSGVGISLGIALMKKAGANLTEAQDPLWNTIVDKVKGVWNAIKLFWNTHIAKWFTKEHWANLAKNMMNGLISKIEEGLNKILQKFHNSGIGEALDYVAGGLGFEIPKSIKIPRLAKGAVIPPNREFLAVLGDQKSGTNIEAPLQTIVDAFNIALANGGGGGGNTEVILEVDGREFGRAVVEQGNRENRRIGTRLVIA